MKGTIAIPHCVHILALFLLSFTLLPAQQWDPIVAKGKMWVSAEADDIVSQSPSWATSHSLRIGDTLGFYGTVYHLLEISHTEQAQQWFAFGLLREDNSGKVWFQTFTCGPERLLYDMGAEAGSTVVITHTTPGTHQVSGSYHIGAVDSIFLAGKLRKRLQVGSGYWIEGIGSTSGLMFSGLEDIAGYNYSLLCYYEDSALVYANDHLNPFYPGCWADVITGFSEEERELPRIYPNPAVSDIHLSFSLSGSDFRISDVQGRDCTSSVKMINDQSLEVGSLGPGIYFLHWNADGKCFHRRFLKR
jgi:hypothetical protein